MIGPSPALRAAVVALALLPAAGVLAATHDPVAAAVALALGPLAAGGAWAAAHRTLAARAERLAAAADRLAAGDLSAREGLRRGGVGRLGRALETVADAIAELSRRAELAERAGEGLVALDLEGRVVYANPAAAALLGAARAELYGRELHALVHAGAVHAPCPLVATAAPARGAAVVAGAPLEWEATALVEGGRTAGVCVALRRAPPP